MRAQGARHWCSDRHCKVTGVARVGSMNNQQMNRYLASIYGAPYAGELFTFLAQIMCRHEVADGRAAGLHQDVSVWQTVATPMRVALHLHLVRPGRAGGVAPVRGVRVRLVVERLQWRGAAWRLCAGQRRFRRRQEAGACSRRNLGHGFERHPTGHGLSKGLT
jgi:hypothetical protein